MTNYSLIEAAVKIVNDYWAAEGIYETDEAIRQRALNWYNNTEIVDAQMLAAAVISGDYEFGTTWDELEDRERFYFPDSIEATAAYQEYHITHDNYSIDEIEGSLRDLAWA